MVLESTGISRAATTPRNMEFEPAANQKIYKFTDVHGVDEAKEVCDPLFFCSDADILFSHGRILWK